MSTNGESVWKRRAVLFAPLLVALAALALVAWIYTPGIVRELPIAVVDHDNTYVSRTAVRAIDAMPTLTVEANYGTEQEIRSALVRGEIVGAVVIPEGMQQRLRRGVDAGEIVDAHLCAGMQGKIGTDGANDTGGAEVLHQRGVRAGFRNKNGKLRQIGQFPICAERIHRHEDLAAALVTILHCVEVFLVREVFCASARVEGAKTEINGVRAVLHGGDHGLRAPGGR